ncbi:MAG: hypothetical protein KDE27_16750 [Planctomycetes bacterium]|nr:hypothetical protein [Planctomycetota bacterium]
MRFLKIQQRLRKRLQRMIADEPRAVWLDHAGGDPDAVADVVCDCTGLTASAAPAVIRKTLALLVFGLTRSDARRVRRQLVASGVPCRVLVDPELLQKRLAS